jgi:hypothetical protein
MIKFNHKKGNKLQSSLFFTKQAIEKVVTKISGKIIVKLNGQNKYSI